MLLKAKILFSEKNALFMISIQKTIKIIKKKLLKNFLFFKKKNDAIAKIDMDKSARKGPDIINTGNKIKRKVKIFIILNL